MTRIYLSASGRMGNHLFQYWVVRWLSDQLGGWPIIYWCDDYGNYMPRCIPGIHYTEDPQQIKSSKDDPNVEHYTEPTCTPCFYNLPALVEKHKASQKPIYLRAYLEDYDILRGYEPYIQRIYDIPHVHKRNAMAIHIRLGDIADKNGPVIPAYKQYILALATQYRLPIEAYTDDPNNPRVHDILLTLSQQGHDVCISNTPSYDPSLDLVHMSGVSVMVIMNSTFSWWAAFLGKNKPRVHVALSEQLGNSSRNKDLFIKDDFNGWELYDLDHESILRPLRV